MTKDEALDLALEALDWISRVNAMDYEYQQKAKAAITAIKQALALDKMAENARELGLDYEPAREDWGPGPHEVHSLPPAAPVQDNDAHYKGVVEGVQKLFDDKRAQRRWTDIDIDHLSVLAGFDPSHKVELGLVRSVVRTILRKENT